MGAGPREEAGNCTGAIPHVTQGAGEGSAQEEKLETDMLDVGPLHSFVNIYLKQ